MCYNKAMEKTQKYKANETIVLLDGNSILNRAFYAMTYLETPNGQPSGAVYGFVTMLTKIIDRYKPKYAAVAFDVHAPTFRHKIYDQYKAGRRTMPEALAVQFEPLKKILATMNIEILSLAGYEADDILGTVAAKSGIKTYIVTGDRDAYQLISDRVSVVMMQHGMSEILEVTPENLPEIFHVSPDKVVDFKAIAGDSSDNITGVKGIGEKGAEKLLREFSGLDDIYAHIDTVDVKLRDKLISGKESAYLSRTLATINCNVPIETKRLELTFPFNRDTFNAFSEMGFKTLLKRAELFSIETGEVVERQVPTAQVIQVTDISQIELGDKIAVCMVNDKLRFSFNQSIEYEIDTNLAQLFGEVLKLIAPALRGGFDNVTVYSHKSLMHAICLEGGKEDCVCEFDAYDIEIASYLLERRHTCDSAAALFDLKTATASELSARNMDNLFKIETDLSHVLYAMEKVGFLLDLETLETYNIRYKQEAEVIEQRVHFMCGKVFNINSPKQLANVLFVDLKIPYPDKPPYSTAKNILDKLAGDNAVIDEILRYRFVTKLRSTFIEGLKKVARQDGTVHTTFNQTVTTTGRLSSTEPNLQNIPIRTQEGSALRSLFIAHDGFMLVSADYSQIELKLLAHLSGEPKLIDAFNNGVDIHRATAAEIFDVPLERVTSAMRASAKAVSFGTIYGISGYGLSENMHISQSKARAYIKKYFERYPVVKQYLDGLVESAKKTGYAITMFNRRRKIPELVSSKFVERQFGERVAMNTPLQGSAADIIKIAMNNVSKRLKDTQSRLILQIHDELIVEAKSEEVDLVKEVLRDCMENAVKISVPLNVEVGVGKNWQECK